MMRLEVIGNLGADAEIKEVNGRKFVSFRIAHTDKWVDSQTQQAQVTTQWVSCAINGDGGKLVPYLKKVQRFLSEDLLLLAHSIQPKVIKLNVQ